METEELLSQLADIHLPAAISFWPPALGWWIALALLLLGFALLCRGSLKALLKQRKLRAVMTELEQTYQEYLERSAFEDLPDQAGLRYLGQLNALLKRVALIAYPQSQAARLSGKAWLEFLDECHGGEDFRTGAGAPLGDGLYRRRFAADPEALQQLARAWIAARYKEQNPSHGPLRSAPA